MKKISRFSTVKNTTEFLPAVTTATQKVLDLEAPLQSQCSADNHDWLEGFSLTNGYGNAIEIPPAIRAEILKRRFRRYTSHLAVSLMASLNIDPLGNLLVSACGTGKEADNAEAVLYWLRNYACCPSCILTLSFSQMQRKFVRFLLDQTGQEYYE